MAFTHTTTNKKINFGHVTNSLTPLRFQHGEIPCRRRNSWKEGCVYFLSLNSTFIGWVLRQFHGNVYPLRARRNCNKQTYIHEQNSPCSTTTNTTTPPMLQTPWNDETPWASKEGNFSFHLIRCLPQCSHYRHHFQLPCCTSALNSLSRRLCYDEDHDDVRESERER